MHIFCLVALAAVSCLATNARAGEGTRYLELVNRAKDSLTSLAVAEAGSDRYREQPLGEPLRGGGSAVIIELAAGSCLQDFRFGFRDGRSMVYRDVDVCRSDKLLVRRLPRAEQTRIASSQGG